MNCLNIYWVSVVLCHTVVLIGRTYYVRRTASDPTKWKTYLLFAYNNCHDGAKLYQCWHILQRKEVISSLLLFKAKAFWWLWPCVLPKSLPNPPTSQVDFHKLKIKKMTASWCSLCLILHSDEHQLCIGVHHQSCNLCTSLKMGLHHDKGPYSQCVFCIQEEVALHKEHCCVV